MKKVKGIILRKSLFIFIYLIFCDFSFSQSLIWLETELFQNKGGWISDTQFIVQMGSPFLMAHGLGSPVEDASTFINFKELGTYHFWVRTRDWIPQGQGPGPGKFNVLLNDEVIGPVFGADEIFSWHWMYGGSVKINTQRIKLSLKDLTGFGGRCDVICFSKEKINLPNNLKDINKFRKKHGGIAEKMQKHGKFDFVVVGGGIAGISAAVQAARLGSKVALIQNRPVLGGNSSSEVRVSTTGSTFVNRYPSIGRIVRELDNFEAGMGGSPELYKDNTREYIVRNEDNITLLVNLHVNGVTMDNGKIMEVRAMNVVTLEEHSIEGDLFADCTGDATLGILAGADHRYGRESKAITGEESAPEKNDNLVMGSSNQWRSVKTEKVTDFPIKPWMLTFTDDYHFPLTSSVWNWESGFDNLHTVYQAEEIRDLNMRAIYSNWAFLKTNKIEQFKNWELKELQHVSGKRESFRLLGDHILTEDDIVTKVDYPDAIVTTNWGIDLHYPDPENSKRFPDMEFIGYAEHPLKEKDIYTFPYRCLYSRNVPNLFMAGRNISVTHIALGTVRVQRTTGMMGEVIGLAAYVCKEKKCLPRDVYNHYLVDFLNLIETGCL
ncbi:MAG: FAD-dependent oxidoreductase [Erysipelotrichales bacterium]|nr:FAD-dependent oxidoreductase [Erysipelotrichales bacterium]